jgi:hypothetical protein
MVAGNGWLRRDDKFNNAGDDVVGLEGIPKGVLSPFVAPVIEKEQQCKKNGEKRLRFNNFSILLLTFFQLNCYFLCNMCSVISVLTDQFLPCRCHHSLEESWEIKPGPLS